MFRAKHVCAAALAFLQVFVAQAADSLQGATVSYDAAFFRQFTPQTALDMVRRVPSFVLREVDEERRGLSGAAGNVLIDGREPSAKSQSLEDILQRIPAAQVVRVEVLRGTETAGSASGNALLINVVRTPSAGAGAWSAGFEYARQGKPAPNGSVSWAGRAHGIEYGLGARTYALRREMPGTRRLTDAGGHQAGTIEESSPREFEEYALDGELASDALGGRLRATGQIYDSHYAQQNTHERRSPDGLLSGDEIAPYSENKRTVELGTYFERELDPWQWAIAGIVTRSRFDAAAQLASRDALGAEQFRFRQLEFRDTGESVVRTTFERPYSSAHRLQIGLEGALNTLDADVHLTASSGGGSEIPIEVPNGDMRVEESRVDAHGLHTWRGESWSTETRLGVETSQLSFSGDARQTVRLTFFKPSLQVSRQIGAHQLRLRLSREVGQLDFADFASAASLADDRIEGGNPDLVPQTAWRMELGADLRLGRDTAIGGRIYHDWIDDVADFVPLLADTDRRVSAPGNIGDGSVYGLQFTLTAPLAAWIPGGTLKADVTLQEPSVDDPVTNRERAISDFQRNTINAEFRQDLRRQGFAWGVKYKYESSKTDYRIEETDRTRKSPSLDVFVEHNLSHTLKLTLTCVSVQSSPELRWRELYEHHRGGPIMGVEDTRRRPGRWVTLMLSGTL